MTDLQQRLFVHAWWRASCAPVLRAKSPGLSDMDLRGLARVMLHYGLLRQRRRRSS